jgi:dTDP-4-dehydrorhamnose reductase
MHRNAEATGVLAAACAAARTDLVVISTNEVFDGHRADGRGYRPDDPTAPINPYGASKLEGEERARRAFTEGSGGAPQLAIVRTAWLFGPPGDDFPAKIVSAAIRASAAGEAVRVVSDEIGSPSYAPDVADAIVELLAAGAVHGVHHVVNAGIASRADWAREVLRIAGLDVAVDDVPAATWGRASSPPRWAVLEPTPLPSGEPLRSWPAALADEAGRLRRAARGASTAGRPA